MRHNTTRGSNFKRGEQIGCKTVQDGSNSLPTNQLPRTIVRVVQGYLGLLLRVGCSWLASSPPRSVAPSPAAHSYEQCWCIWAGPGCPSLSRCPANDGRLPPADRSNYGRIVAHLFADWGPLRPPAVSQLRFGDAASRSLMRTTLSFFRPFFRRGGGDGGGGGGDGVQSDLGRRRRTSGQRGEGGE